MTHMRRMTLKREVFTFTLILALVASVVIMLTIALVLYSARTRELKEKLNNASTQSVTYLNTLFSGDELLLEYLARSMDVLHMNPDQRDESLAVLAQEEDGRASVPAVFVAYSDGYLLMNEFNPPREYDVTTRPWYQEAVKHYPDTLVAYPFEAFGDTGWCMVTATALADETGQIRAVIGAIHYAEDIYQSVPMQYQYETQEVFLVNRDGLCIYHPDAALINTQITDGLYGGQQWPEGDYGYIKIDISGVVKIGYYSRIENSDSILVSVADRSEVLKPAMVGVTVLMSFMFLLSLGVAIFFSYLFEKHFVRPVHLLKNRMTELLNGKQITESLPVYHNMEFHEIASSMEVLAEHVISQRVEELNAVIESTSDGILVLDKKGKILHYNSRLIELLDLDPSVKYRTMADLALESIQMNGENCGCLAVDPVDDNDTSLCYLKSGRILERYTRLLKGRNNGNGVLCIFQDVTQKVKKEEMLIEKANTDYLTGLANRRQTAFLTRREMNSAFDNGEPLSLMLIDLDRFKEINDTYGHDIGDIVLKVFADHLRECSRRSDILGRYGGDEFIMLLPQTGSDLSLQIAERIRGFIENTVLVKDEHHIRWTVSIGVASISETVNSFDLLMKQADLACYAAKQKGRNRVVGDAGEEEGSAFEK